MSASTFYPFKTGADRIRVDIKPIEGEIPTSSDGSILAYHSGQEILKVEISVVLPDSLAEEYVPDSEKKDPPVQVILVCRSNESRKRFSLPLNGSGVYLADLECRKDEWFGTLIIQAALVRTQELVPPVPGFGADKGSFLSWSEEKRILFDQPSVPPGEHIEVAWEKFSESPDPWLNSHADNIFALNLEALLPKISLNEEISGAKTIFSSMGTTGTHARIRDASFHMIVHQAWSSIVSTAFSALTGIRRNYDDSEPVPDLILAELIDWQQRILRDWSRYLYPEHDASTALEMLVDTAGKENGNAEIMGRLPNAIQTRLRTYRGYEGLVKEFVR